MNKPIIKGSIGKLKESKKPYEGDKDGDFALWVEQNRKTEKHPNLSGHIKLNGKYYWFNGYIDDALIGGESVPSDDGIDFDDEMPF